MLVVTDVKLFISEINLNCEINLELLLNSIIYDNISFECDVLIEQMDSLVKLINLIKFTFL